MDGTGRGEDDLEAFARQETRVGLFHLALRLGELALFEQEIAGFLLGRIGVHWMGTSISFFVLRSSTLVWPARLVKVSACMVAAATNRLVATRAPMGAKLRASPSLSSACFG